VITGAAEGFEAASVEKLQLESTLRSGSLPIKLEIAKVDTITQTAGRELVNSTVFVALAAVIAVSAIVFYRYRDYKIVLPMVVISLSEIVIVVGMATSQILAGIVIAIAVAIGILKKEITGVIGWITLLAMVMVASTIVITQWTLDIPAIAGLIAILGTGVNQMIIMTDQLFREKGKALSEKHKSAMHIIWSSAAIVAFAMIPLVLGGIGSLKGFAIATIVGVLVGILVTRPAYVAILERIKKVQLESV
jgi:preprotein translocase subunit SecD